MSMSQQSRMEPSPQKQLEQMSDAELAAELDRALAELQGAIGGQEQAMEAAPAAPMAPAPQAMPPAPAPGGDMMLGSVPPEQVQSATAKMVAMGLLNEATTEITPELIMALQVIIDAIDPGLYNLQQPEQLKEFINGVNSGAIDLAIAVNRARELTGQQPIPTGAGVPVGAAAGFVPGGVFGGAPAGAAPAGAAPAAGFGAAAGAPRPI
jgi:hypothetical protein